MKKRIIFSALTLAGLSFVNAQVGINTEDPKTTLHVVGTNDNGAVAATDGVLVPRVNALAVNGTEDGQLVYLIADAGTFDKGFHFWNATNSAWEPIADAEAIAGDAEIRKVAGGNIISSEAGSTDGIALSTGAGSEDNIAIGRGAAGTQDSGIRNVMIGLNSGAGSDDPGNDNIYLGFNSGREVENNGSNVAIGINALRELQGSSSANTIAIGSGPLNGAIANGSENIAIGRLTGNGTTLNANNILLGVSTAQSGTIGSDNIFVGRSNSVSITSAGNRNTAVGAYQLRGGSTIGLGNSLFGANVFDNSTLGNNNIGVGAGTGQNIIAGSQNILLGQTVADGQTVVDNNIAIGNGIAFPVTGTGATASDQLNIQNAIFGTGNSLGGTNVAPAGKIGIGQPAPEERLDVDGIAKSDNVRVDFEVRTSAAAINKENSIIVSSANQSLPVPTADYDGITISITNSGTSGITFNGAGATVNGTTANTRVIPVGNTFKFTSNGSEWFITAQM